MRFSNPRSEALIGDWPSGQHRVTARFVVESSLRYGERVVRTTTKPRGGWSKPKCSCYCTRMWIVDGDDGRAYAVGAGNQSMSFVIYDGTLKTARYVFKGSPQTGQEYADLAAVVAPMSESA